MLKNKKAVYILIPLNLLIWSFFIYRFYTAYNDTGAEMPEDRMRVEKLAPAHDSVTYKLNLSYKDPFLRDAPRHYAGSNLQAGAQQAPAKPAPVKPPVPTPAKQLPELRYLGLVKNNSSGSVNALVSINGQSRLVKQNETAEGMQFKIITRDSIVVRYGKDRIVVRK